MSPNRKVFPEVEPLGSRVLLSAMGAMPRKFVDVTGDIMRQDLSSAPRAGRHSGQVYSLQGVGGVAEMGRVETTGSVTETSRGGTPSYRGSVTLANDRGSVKISFTSTSYRILGGTGQYKGATGLGGVSIGNVPGQGLVGLAFTADL